MCTVAGEMLWCGPTGCLIPTALEWPQLAALRRGVRDFTSEDDPDAAGDVLLVVNELVTNAAEHGRPPIEVELTRDRAQQTIHLSVTDASPDLPQLRDPYPGGGHGLLILTRLATAWGTSPHPPGKTIWADLPLTRPAPAASR